MSETIIATLIAGLISGAVSITVCLINSHNQMNRITFELEKHNAIQDERLKALTAQAEKHNSVIDRTYKLEQSDQLLLYYEVNVCFLTLYGL